MSREEIEKVCFDLRDDANAHAFETDADSFLGRYRLAEEEQAALKAGDIGYLYRRDVVYGAIEPLARLFKYDNEAYVRRLREAAGLPESAEQIGILRRRAALRRTR